MDLGAIAQAIIIELDAVSPWPASISSLAQTTRQDMNQVAQLANTTDYSPSNMSALDEALVAASNDASEWKPTTPGGS
ncbi:hypothetical protein LK10_11260 [Sinomonas humi]|uniref:Uncharacterized protein n=1 Tax=Sinomonas humi TaxID=1338436 RepID=A0A0B2AM68_9MICC|nr:hypothetical protein LK10_11260 [Sinomonas humi]